MRYYNEDILQERAKKLGYSNIEDALLGLYNKLKSTERVADTLCLSRSMVTRHLKGLGVSLRKNGKPSNKFKCPSCGGENLIRDSRKTQTFIRRRHQCKNCAQRFTTYQTLED